MRPESFCGKSAMLIGEELQRCRSLIIRGPHPHMHLRLCFLPVHVVSRLFTQFLCISLSLCCSMLTTLRHFRLVLLSSQFSFASQYERLCTLCRFFISGGMEGDVRVWDIKSRDMVCNLKEHKQMVTQVVCFADDTLALSCSRDKSIMCWDLRDACS